MSQSPLAAWRDAQQALLLPIPYFHLVFTVPHELNGLMRTNPRRTYAILFQAVAATLKTFAHDPRHLGAELGVTAVLHTWSQTPVDHFHVHCIVAGGGLACDGTGWRRSKGRRYLFPVAAMAALFRGKFLARLVAAHRRGALVCTGPSAALADPLAWQQLLTQLHAKAWYVYAKAPFAGPKQAVMLAGIGTNVTSGFLLRHGASNHSRSRRRKEIRTGWPGSGRGWPVTRGVVPAARLGDPKV